MRYIVCDLVLVLGIATFGFTGEATVQPLRPPPQAETERKPEVRTVSLEDIQDQQVRIIGKLRCALWTVVTVRGSWHSEESKPQPPVFRVTDVNGKPLARVADFDKIEPESGKGGDETRMTEGQVWELRCFEMGGFIGAPDEAYKEIGGPPVQRPPQGFLTKLCYISARRSPVARGDKQTNK